MTSPVTTKRRHAAYREGERGSVSLFLAITVVGLLILAGLVADGGAKLRATQRADAVAQEAARAAGQAINVPTAIAGGTTSVDVHAATSAAQAYFAANDVAGTVAVDGGTTIEVTVHDVAPTIFLGLIGITTLDVTGHATVALVHGITGAGT